MKRTTIVRVAEWTGWCGPCAAERPLVLTRDGRHSLLSWLTGAGAEQRPLTLTCRLCGIGVLVPPEEDDPDVGADDALLAPTAHPSAAARLLSAATTALGATQPGASDRVAPLPGRAPAAVPGDASSPVEALQPPSGPMPVGTSMTFETAPLLGTPPTSETSPPLGTTLPVDALPAGSTVPLGDDLHLARQAVGDVLGALLRARTAPATTVVAPAPALPLQRSAEPPAVDGLQALQLLAEGLDLLSPTRR